MERRGSPPKLEGMTKSCEAASILNGTQVAKAFALNCDDGRATREEEPLAPQAVDSEPPPGEKREFPGVCASTITGGQLGPATRKLLQIFLDLFDETELFSGKRQSRRHQTRPEGSVTVKYTRISPCSRVRRKAEVPTYVKPDA